MIRLKQIIAFSVVFAVCILAISVCALAAVPNPVPDTGQTQSSTNTFGEDSDYTINTPSYTKLDASGIPLVNQNLSYLTLPWSMVKDNVTGLIWEVKTANGDIHDKDKTYNWYNADLFINDLNTAHFGGFLDNGWRLPTVKELSFIVNSGTYNPAINTAYFPNTPQYPTYWSSTTTANDSKDKWSVSFYNGEVLSCCYT
jgi:hypothetical protein